MRRHTILFLAANPLGVDRRALDREARAIQEELARSGHRECFDFVTRWAAEPLDLLRELRALKPSVVHFSGLGGARSAARAVGSPTGESSGGLYFQNANGDAQRASTEAVALTFGAVGASTQLVVLGACYSDAQAEALVPHVPCVVGMTGALDDAAARHFATGFYGGLGDGVSVADAYQHGCAAMSLMGLLDADKPQLRARPGIDARHVVLAANRPAAGASGPAPSGSAALARETTTAASEPQPAQAASPAGRAPPRPLRPTVDVGILTSRPDEFRAVLAAFPAKVGAGVYKGERREYSVRHADAGDGERYTIAVLRQIDHGNGEAQNAARDLLDDLAPKLVLVVGIAGGLPSDATLGDVVVGTRIHDLAVEARETGDQITFAASGGPIDRRLAGSIANLDGRQEIGDWSAALSPRPAVTWADGQVYGPTAWQDRVRTRLEHHHGAAAAPRAPIYVAGPIASSDRLIMDPELLFPWITTARNLLAVETESGGIYRALRERCPMLPIRGISDVVGLQRSEAWAHFACASAAAFAAAFLRTRPVPLDAVTSDPIVALPALPTPAGLVELATQAAAELSQFRALFRGTRAQIALLAKYKGLHDVLQELEVPFHVVLHSQKRLLASRDAWEELRDPLDSVAFLVEKTLQLLESEPLKDEFATSRQRLSEASVMLQAADAGDTARLRGAIFHVQRVLAVEISSANNRLLTTARQLRLRDVVAALRSVHDSVQPRATRVAIHELGQLVTSLNDQHTRLEALVQEHDQWQGIGNELRLAVSNDRLSHEEAQLSWELVRGRLATMLAAASSATWAATVKPASDKVDHALLGADPGYLGHLRSLWRRCNQRFMDVDKQLLRTCEDLRRLGDTLDALLKVMR